jgi:hypothetical protein
MQMEAGMPSPNKFRSSPLPVLLAALILFVAASALRAQTPAAQQSKPAAESSFSFAVYGDSRTMMYLPYRAAEKADATKYMVDMFSLAFPENVAKDVKLIYDPKSGELTKIVMPFLSDKLNLMANEVNRGTGRSATNSAQLRRRVRS